jgi:two-component system cell cycle sensor histidine kinase/response regulator CckA
MNGGGNYNEPCSVEESSQSRGASTVEESSRTRGASSIAGREQVNLETGHGAHRLAVLRAMPQTESALLRFAFEHSSDGMLLTDPNGVIRMANNAFVRMFGFTREDVIGERTGFLRSQYSTQEFYDAMSKSLHEHGEWKGEIINRTKQGLEKTCFLTITSILSETGERLGYLGVEIDLTERKRLESQLIQGEKLAAIGESVATLVHEIRNPLNGIAMNIYMLEHSANTDKHWAEEERESIHLISREAKRLESLVKNVLTYARNVELRYERVILSDFLEELEELLIFQAEQRDVTLKVLIQHDKLTGRFDPDQMKQVMLNLVQNAIEAAEQSDQRAVQVQANLRVDASWRPISSSGRVILFEVANSGTGISEEVRSHLFRPFFTTKPQGLGLGLATSAKIVRQHHGILDIRKADQPPFTTVFTVALPA